jgi:hypothetical protein
MRIFTCLVDVVLALLYLIGVEEASYIGLFSYNTVALGKKDKLVSWDVVFLDCLANDLFRSAIRVDICGIPCVQPGLVGIVQKWECLCRECQADNV